MSSIINTHRHLVLLVDFRNTNPQGSPDQENMPRQDPETGKGLISGAGPKRKIRDWLSSRGQDIYVNRGSCFQRTNRELATSVGVPDVFGADDEDAVEADEELTEVAPTKADKKGRGKDEKRKAKVKPPKATPEQGEKIFAALCKKYIDARLFGQLVPRLGGALRGPVQFSMGESIDQVQPTRMTITRVAVATEDEEESQKGNNRMMGGQWFLPYGLYRFHIYVNPWDARRTGCTEEDYDLFLTALQSIYEIDRSSARNTSCVRALYEFRENPRAPEEGPNMADPIILGEQLLESIRVVRKDPEVSPRSFSDYRVIIPNKVLTSSKFVFRKIVSEENPWVDTTEDVAAE